MPPINGLTRLIKALQFYKYFVPAGLARRTTRLDWKSVATDRLSEACKLKLELYTHHLTQDS